MQTRRRARSIVRLAVFTVVAATAGRTDVLGQGRPAPDANAADVGPLAITDVQSSRSCEGDWSVELGAGEDGAVIALLGSDTDFTVALAGDGVTASVLSNCTLRLQVQTAPTLSYALKKVSYEGRASLDEGMLAEQRASYGFVGGAAAPEVNRRIVGPYAGGAVLDEAFPEDGLVWSRCNTSEPLQIRTSLFLDNDGRPLRGSLSMSLAHGMLLLVLEFATRPCPAP